MILETTKKKKKRYNSWSNIFLFTQTTYMFQNNLDIPTLTCKRWFLWKPTIYLQNVGQTRWGRWSRGTRRCSAPFWATRRNISDSTETVYRPEQRIDQPASTQSQSWTWTRTRARRRRNCAKTGRPRATWTPRSARTTTARRARTIIWRSTATSATLSRWRTRISAVPASRWRRAAKRAIRATAVASPNKETRKGPSNVDLPSPARVDLVVPSPLSTTRSSSRSSYIASYRSSVSR